MDIKIRLVGSAFNFLLIKMVKTKLYMVQIVTYEGKTEFSKKMLKIRMARPGPAGLRPVQNDKI